MSLAAVWLDGALVAPDDAVVSVADHGFTVGDGVFEALLVVDGTPFALRRHLDRLGRSAAGMGIAVPARAVLERAVEEVVAAAGLPEARLRLTVTAGTGPLGSGRGSGAPTVVAAVSALDPRPDASHVHVVPWPRNERGALAGLKTTSYAENVVALARARAAGADEAVFANTAGNLCEGTGSNVFVAHQGRLLTPPLSSGCLAGVTRELLVELLDVDELDVPVTALAEAREAFLASTIRGVQPVAVVDGCALPQVPGPLTSAASEAFAALVATQPDP